MNSILQSKSQLKSSLNTHLNISDKILQDQTNNNTSLRRKLEQGIKDSHDERLERKKENVIEMKREIKDMERKKVEMKESV